MNTSATTVRRGLFGVFAGGLLAFGSAAIVAPVANAQPAPGPDCSAAGVAGTVSTAAASEGAYLTANPQTNETLSNIASQAQPEAQQAFRTYFEENPEVKDQLTAIYQPVSAINNQCNVQVTPTPVAQAVWNGTETATSPEAAETPAPAAETPETPSN
ncbi:hemophore-related protein [Mycolicibacterium hippocampi]|uniref:hemophore-related protein n=1 Tax=Mycolicibacterium hippocampi TaxID=659824 RepID=UPI003516BC6F